MAEQVDQLLQQAEQLLREGRKQEARTILVGYVRSNPSSTRGWWMLSFALTDPKQQIDCIEHVLKLDPYYVPAQTRLLKLKNDIVSQLNLSSVEQFSDKKEKSHLSSAISSAPEKENSAPQSIRVRKQIPVKKKMSWLLPFAVVSMSMSAVVIIIIGFFVALENLAEPAGFLSSQVPLTTSTRIHGQPLPPTWTSTFAISTSTSAPNSPIVPVETIISTSDTMTPQDGIIVPQSQYGLPVGTTAPDFVLKNVVTGKQEGLSDYLGHPVMLFFFIAETCDYCDFEASHLEDIYTTYQDDGLIILGIVSGGSPYGEDGIRQEARTYGKLHGLTFPILNDWEWKVFELYKVDGFPINYFVDQNGVITSYNRGSMDYPMINLKVRIMLGLIPTPAP